MPKAAPDDPFSTSPERIEQVLRSVPCRYFNFVYKTYCRAEVSEPCRDYWGDPVAGFHDDEPVSWFHRDRWKDAIQERHADLKWWPGLSDQDRVHWVSEVGPTLCGITSLAEWTPVDVRGLERAGVPWCQHCRRAKGPFGNRVYGQSVLLLTSETGWPT